MEKVLRLLRSGLGGLLATLADLGALTLLVQGFGVSARAASVPALLAGNLVMFVAQKKVAFRSSGGSVTRELSRFALVQAGGFLLTALIYDLALAFVPGAREAYVVTRLVVTNLVWLCYSYPLWHWVFPTRAGVTAATGSRSANSRSDA